MNLEPQCNSIAMESQYSNIEKYILGELSELEKEIFEISLQSDTELVVAVAQHKIMMERLNSLRIRNKVKDIILKKQTKRIPTYRNVILIAASLLLLICAIWLLYQPTINTPLMTQRESMDSINDSLKEEKATLSSKDTFDGLENNNKQHIDEKNNPSLRLITLANAFLVFPTFANTRDLNAQDNQSSSFQLAIDSYNKAEYKNSLIYLNKLKIENENEEELYLRAHVFFQLKEFENAARDFRILENSIQFMNEAKWNYLLCQISLGKLNTANALLEKMITNIEFPYHDKAKELKLKFNF